MRTIGFTCLLLLLCVCQACGPGMKKERQSSEKLGENDSLKTLPVEVVVKDLTSDDIEIV